MTSFCFLVHLQVDLSHHETVTCIKVSQCQCQCHGCRRQQQQKQLCSRLLMWPQPPPCPQHKGWSCLALPQLGPWQAPLQGRLPAAAAGKQVCKLAVRQLLLGRHPLLHNQAVPEIRSGPPLLKCSAACFTSSTIATGTFCPYQVLSSMQHVI